MKPRMPLWTPWHQLSSLLACEEGDLEERVASGELWLATGCLPLTLEGNAEIGGCAEALNWDAPGIWYIAPADTRAVLESGGVDAVAVRRLYTSNGPICCGYEGPNARPERRASYRGFDLVVDELTNLERRAAAWWQAAHKVGRPWWHCGAQVSEVIGWVDLDRPLLLEAEDLFLPDEERAWWVLDGPGRDRKDPQRQAAAIARWNAETRWEREQARVIAKRLWASRPEFRIAHVADYVISVIDAARGRDVPRKTVIDWIEEFAPPSARATGRPPRDLPMPSDADLQ